MASNPPYEIVMPVHPKDFSKLPHVLERAFRFTDADIVRLVTPDPGRIAHLAHARVRLYADEEVLPVPRDIFTWRQGWIYQQFIVLFQHIAETEWYLGMNADLLMNRHYPVFEDGRPLIVLARDPNQRIKKYRVFNEKMLGVGWAAPFGFLSDCTLYNRAILDGMLVDRGYTLESFMRKAAAIIDRDCEPGDAEVYGNWVWHTNPTLYKTIRLKNWMNGKYGGEEYTDHEIERLVAAGSTYDTISIHSWSMEIPH